VPPNVTVTGAPARIVGPKPGTTCHYGLPETESDPVGETISGLLRDVEMLKVALNEKGAKPAPAPSPVNDPDYAERWKGSGI